MSLFGALTNLRCLMLAPDGKPCRWRCDDEIDMTSHVAAHQEGQRGVVYDNCQVCRYPIRLTKAGVLRVHGPVGERCSGGGEVGRFVLRCRGELA